jgi:1-acyl-sn-glycerol-3-phosphate acyltransferase
MPDPSHFARPLPLWRCLVIALMRRFYFHRIRVAGDLPKIEGAHLILVSHRNGAIDGYSVLAAYPEAQFLISIQLLRKFLLRLMFAGIPVVRAQDKQRYGIKRSVCADPIAASCDYLRAGGTLALFPEGTSDWGPHPQPYQAGSARIVRRLLEEGVKLTVTPLGLFYHVPDRFRSDVDLLPGPPVVLPPQNPGETPRAWEKRIAAALEEALDAVSPNCPDMDVFARVEKLAAADAGSSSSQASYAQAFKHWEAVARNTPEQLPEASSLPVKKACGCQAWVWPFIVCFCLVFAPVLLVGAYVGTKADGRNTVSFFRIIGGFATALVWLPVLLVLWGCFPLRMTIALLLAGIGGWKWKR